jgi:hypothetical protein
MKLAINDQTSTSSSMTNTHAAISDIT